jgi:hypothetical protein
MVRPIVNIADEACSIPYLMELLQKQPFTDSTKNAISAADANNEVAQ